MTQRRNCGSCCFFEASTVPGNGWCRNPDYADRDETALLRAEELGCRGGWGKDFYQARAGEPVAAPSPTATTPAEFVAVLPIGQGFGALADNGEAKGDAAAKSGFPTGPRRRPQGGATAPPSFVKPEQRPAVPLLSTMQNHPELAPTGEMIRRPTRSIVAEAHRKALQRRENERAVGTVRRQEQHEAAIKTMFSGKPGGEGPTTPAPQPTVEAAPTTRPAPLPTGGGDFVAPPPRPATERPLPPTPLARLDDLDRPIAPERPSTFLSGAKKLAREDDEAQPTTIPNAPIILDEATSRPVPVAAQRAAQAMPPTRAEESAPKSEAPYWYESGGASRPARMRPEPSAPTGPRASVHTAETLPDVPTVGRARGEQPAPSPSPSGRTIRPLQPLGATREADEDGPRVALPTTRPSRPTAAAAPPRQAEPVAPAALPPRKIDPELVRQLQQGWRETALAAHAKERCGTCRFFQAAEGAERGTCGCPFAYEAARQPLGRQDLGCLTPLGTWWAAGDEGWLQKADLGQRQPTPLVDQLLTELGSAELVADTGERRRVAR